MLDSVGGVSGASAGAAIAQARSDPPPTPAQIERTYQVADDRMEDWSPSLFGAIPLGGLGGTRNLTVTEGNLLDNLTRDKGLLGLREFSNIADQAFEVSEARVPPSTTIPPAAERQIAAMPAEMQDIARRSYPLNDGHTDAFRHAYWNATMTAEFGENWTKQFATAHEGVPGNYAAREAMDLYNNEVGRRIAVENPSASRAELADKVLEALNNGELVVVDRNGRLAWSDDVARGQHGVSPLTVAPGAIQTPAGNASANGS